MIRYAKLRSLAKINLDLRVLHKRDDGYHELRTVFQIISLADVIEIEYQPARRTSLKIDDNLNIPDNLILRAAQVVLDQMKVRGAVRFRLKKNIPMGGGLGGGSSNAAAVLLALPVLAGRHLTLEKLMELGAQLGSDVPFFLDGGTAVGVGRGTEMYGLPDITPEPLALLLPGIHVSTARAYQALGRELTSGDVSPKINKFQEVINFQRYVRTLGETRSASAASQFSANDFEPAVFGLYPTMKSILGKMRKVSAENVSPRMTGSGSTLFAIFGSKAARDQACTNFKGDRELGQYRVMSAALVSRTGYHRLWRKQLAEHVTAAENDSIWPPRSRYAQ